MDIGRKVALAAAGAVSAIGLALAGASGAQAPNGVQLQMEVKIPLRDGTKVNATLFRPAGPVKPAPVVFMMTPYPDDTSHPSGAYFAEYGLNYVYVDSRGRGDSEGRFTPFENDGPDGYDVVEWLAKQPWSNGQVAMFGGSYAGGDQWQVAGQHPPHLVAIAPVASVRTGVDFPMSNNIGYDYEVQWLTYVTGQTLHAATFGVGSVWQGGSKRFFQSGKAFETIDEALGSPQPMFHTWNQHPTFDSYWRKMALSREQVAGITIPMLVITGAHDGDQQGTLSYYADHASADGTPPANYHLVIGPWNHGGTREPKQDFDGEHFEKASLLDVRRLHLEWYRHVFSGAPLPAFLEKNVAYYVMGEGAECWKYADSLAAIGAKKQTLFLNAADGAKSLYASGVLQASARGAQGGEWVSDPTDLSRADPKPGQPGEELHGDGLIFHSAPFEQDTEIDGRVSLKAALAIDGPDADLAYGLYLVTPDGKAHALSGSSIRARYRTSLERAVPVTPGKVEDYDFGEGQWFAIRAPKGSRLRLLVFSVNEPGAQKNWNSMKPIAEQTSADAHREAIRLVQTAEHPSTLTIGLGDPSATCKASADW